jgi:osmotically-inducible protein OsmY
VLLARVRDALANDPELAGETFELLTSGRTGLALHGWVSTRAVRLRAQRTAEAAAGQEPIVNRLLVRGEDDSHVTLVRDDAPRSA